jgi:PKD repeat protein
LLDLNTLLNGNSAIGTWIETTASGQFTSGTGVLDGNGLASGLYTFTYTVTGTSCPDDVALFEVTINSMETAGSDNMGSICSDGTIDLNTLLIGNSVGGTWSETTSSGQLNTSSGVFDAANLSGGFYLFEYEVTSPCGNDTAVFTITVNEVVANFIASPLVGEAPLDVTFTNTSSGALTYVWDLGNGLSGSWVDTSTTYDVVGSYIVTLVADNGFGCSDTYSKRIYTKWRWRK